MFFFCSSRRHTHTHTHTKQMSLSDFDTPFDILNKLCEVENAELRLSNTNKQHISTISAADWLSWLNKQNGRTKLLNLTNKTEIIEYIEKIVLELSANDYSRLTDPIWSSVDKNDKRIVQSIITLPYPYLIDKRILKFSDVNLPTDFDMLRQSIQTAIRFLKSSGVGIYKSSQMSLYLNLIMQSINNVILNGDKNLLFQLKHDTKRLFFILFHPGHHNKIKGLNIFINYIISDEHYDLFYFDETNYEEDLFNADLQIFGNSAEHYLKQTNKNTIIQINKEIEDKWWKLMCKDMCKNISNFVLNYYKPVDYVSTINNILKNNANFMNKMTECAKSLKYDIKNSMFIWKQLASKLVKINIFKDSEEGGHFAILIYHAIGIPCFDIIASDTYVNSLSDDDKELLTLWTHACNLLQRQEDVINNNNNNNVIAEQDNEKMNKEMQDLTRKPYLRNRLHQIFMQAPKTSTDLIFYRGLSKKCSQLKKTSNNPIAVSFDIIVAKTFSNNGGGCLLKITVPKNSNILAIDRVSIFKGEESEILLPTNSNFIEIPKDENNNNNNYYDDDDNLISVKFQVNENINSKFVPLPKPIFTHKEMSFEEFKTILIKSEIVEETSDNMDHVEMIDQLTAYERNEYKSVSKELFKALRTWQIIYCGFGDVQLAITEFWRLACTFTSGKKSREYVLLKKLQAYCDSVWTFKKSLLSQNKVARSLDALQDFVRPFMIEQKENI